MTKRSAQKDLVVLTADKNAQFAFKGLLTRHRALGVRAIEADLYVHPERDPGVRTRAHDFLRPFASSHAHALAMLDLEGSGRDATSREDLEAEIESRLNRSGWSGRAAAIVVAPELDVWVWSDSPHVEDLLGWKGRTPRLRDWLLQRDWLVTPSLKPERSKEALEAVLLEVRKPRSSAVHQALAEKVSLGHCSDPAFRRLRATLQQWFGAK